MPKLKKFKDTEFEKLYNLKYSDAKIAQILNVSTSAIKERRYKLKLLPNKFIRLNSNPEESYKRILLRNRDYANSYIQITFAQKLSNNLIATFNYNTRTKKPYFKSLCYTKVSGKGKPIQL